MSNEIQPQRLRLHEDDLMPNNPVLPALVYRQVLGGDIEDKAGAFERHFQDNGWCGLWRNGIYGYHHFHPDAHEALGIAGGSVTVRIGGESGETLDLRAGDLVILPAGTGHKRLSGSDDLLVIGAYPEGQQDYHMCRDKAEMAGNRETLINVPHPGNDPFYGPEGPLVRDWH